MKKALALILVFAAVLNLAGCETLRKKFTRKKKETVKMPRIYQVKKYEKKPTPELYKKHFSYWASWQSEMIKTLGVNNKKDKLCIEQIVSNLNDMQGILLPDKAAALQVHIDNLMKVKDIVDTEELSQFNKTYISRTLEREERFIKREFIYSRVKDKLRTSFDEGR